MQPHRYIMQTPHNQPHTCIYIHTRTLCSWNNMADIVGFTSLQVSWKFTLEHKTSVIKPEVHLHISVWLHKLLLLQWHFAWNGWHTCSFRQLHLQVLYAKHICHYLVSLSLTHQTQGLFLSSTTPSPQPHPPVTAIYHPYHDTMAHLCITFWMLWYRPLNRKSTMTPYLHYNCLPSVRISITYIICMITLKVRQLGLKGRDTVPIIAVYKVVCWICPIYHGYRDTAIFSAQHMYHQLLFPVPPITYPTPTPDTQHFQNIYTHTCTCIYIHIHIHVYVYYTINSPGN